MNVALWITRSATTYLLKKTFWLKNAPWVEYQIIFKGRNNNHYFLVNKKSTLSKKTAKQETQLVNNTYRRARRISTSSKNIKKSRSSSQKSRWKSLLRRVSLNMKLKGQMHLLHLVRSSWKRRIKSCKPQIQTLERMKTGINIGSK